MIRRPKKLTTAVAVTLSGHEPHFDRRGNLLSDPITRNAELERLKETSSDNTHDESIEVHGVDTFSLRDTARHPRVKHRRKVKR
jgi:hypothetical protein